MRMRLIVVSLLACAASPAAAQSAQAFSVQVSGLYAGLFGQANATLKSGFGAEAQLRYTPGAVSIGGGFQWTRHSTTTAGVPLKLYGVFIEPRYVIPTRSNTVAPYVSSRISLLKQDISDAQFRVKASGFTGNLGGGFLFRAGPRMNVDVGASFGYTHFGDRTLTDKVNGTETTGPGGNGSNVVGRVGLAFGI